MSTTTISTTNSDDVVPMPRARNKEKNESNFPQVSNTKKTMSNYPKSQKTSSIPLTVRFCEDPRLMKTRRLREELEKRNIDTSGGRTVLSSRLLAKLVEEGLRDIPDPLLMDDRQPEKWMLIATLSSRHMNQLEPDGRRRMQVMKEVNDVLDAIKTSRDNLMAVATGQRQISSFDPQCTVTPLHEIVARFATALMIEPVVEAELCESYRRVLPDAHRVITSSRTIFNMRTGSLQIPERLTVHFAEEIEIQRKTRTVV
jgi:hypothetical protein